MKKTLALILIIAVSLLMFPPTLKHQAVEPGLRELLFATSFEAEDVGVTARGGATQVSVVGDFAHHGIHSLLISNRTHVNHGAQIDLSEIVVGGVTYEFSLWARMATGAPATNIVLTADIIGSPHQIGGAGAGSLVTINFTNSTRNVTSAGWTQLTGTLTLEEDFTDFIVYVRTTNNASASFFIDHIEFYRVSALPPARVDPGQEPGFIPELKVYLDQERQEIDGFVLSGAFRQADWLLNGLADYPELQKEILDLVFGLEGKGIGLSIWRNMIGDQQEIGNYRWNQWGRWFDGPTPTTKTAATHTERASTVGADGVSNFDGDNFRWWFDASYGNIPDWSGLNIPNGGNTASSTLSGPRPNLRQIDPLQQTREGGREGTNRGNAEFDRFEWPQPSANADQNTVARNGRAPLDRGQVWAMRMAMEYAEARGEEMKIISALWSPPAWLKNTGNTFLPRINAQSISGVDEQNWRLFAEYLADYVQGFEKIYGIPLYGISIANEPNHVGTGYSATFWAPAAYERVMREHIGPVWEERGLAGRVRLMIGDQANFNTNYYRPFWDNAATDTDLYQDYIFHSYGNSVIAGALINTEEFRELKLRAQNSGKSLYETEISTMSGQNFTSWDYGLNNTRTANGTNQPSTMGVALGWGQKWMRQMGIMEANGFAQWWAWGFKRPDPTWSGSPADNSLENLIYIANDSSGTWGGMTTTPGNAGTALTGGLLEPAKVYVHKLFWVFGHFSKFVRPGWLRVNNYQTPIYETIANVPVASQFLNVMSNTFRSPKPDENGYYDFAIVTINGTTQEQTLNLSFPGYTVESVTPWRTKEDGPLYAPLRTGCTDGNNMQVLSPILLDASGETPITLEPASMYTFVGKAKPMPDHTIDATSNINASNFNKIEGWAIFNNSRDLQDPRVETLPIPINGLGQWSNNTHAAIIYNNINFGAGVDELILNVGGPGQGGVTIGEVHVRVYAGNVLISKPDQTVQTNIFRADQRIMLFPSAGVHDLTIVLGREGSNVRTRLNTLRFVPMTLIKPHAASNVAEIILEYNNINPSYRIDRRSGNHISDVARLMGPSTDFRGVTQSINVGIVGDIIVSNPAYREAVYNFLREQPGIRDRVLIMPPDTFFISSLE